EAYRECVEKYTPERAERETGVPAEVIREAAHTYARAERAQICWTLGITEHHNAVDNVLALINLALLTGHVGCYGSGLNPLRGQNNVQGGGDMGAIPDRRCTRRHRGPLQPGPAPGPQLGRAECGMHLGRSAQSESDARRYELPPFGRARWYPMALLRRVSSGRDVSAQPPLANSAHRS